MRYKKVLARRTFLRGFGGVAIGLPLLDEMLVRSAWAAPPAPPVRAFNVFFGLGVPAPLQAEGYDGPLAPLAPLQKKLALIRGIDQTRCDRPGMNAHYDGAAGAFTAEPPDAAVRAGGPSLDQVIRHAAYPRSQPSGIMPSLLMGTFFRRDRLGRYVHSWNRQGLPADIPHETPRDLFARIFGDELISKGPSGADRLHRSVLDSVVAQYRHFTSEASNLSRASRARISEHLDRIREYEQRAFAPDRHGPQLKRPGCHPAEPPAGSPLPHHAEADPDGQGVDVILDDLVGEWRLMADLYTLAIRCDLVRFGSVTFQAAGERIRLKGRYVHRGRPVFEFDDRRHRKADGDKGCSHEYWHEFKPAEKNEHLRAHIHLMMREIHYLLAALDRPEDREPNGRTILENALVTISTESGDGRHNDPKRELSQVFHAMTSAGGRFRVGATLEAQAEGLDFYNTILRGMKIEERLGPRGRKLQEVSQILV
jgi:hypothetical protein